MKAEGMNTTHILTKKGQITARHRRTCGDDFRLVQRIGVLTILLAA
jgi:hypothetical protein